MAAPCLAPAAATANRDGARVENRQAADVVTTADGPWARAGDGDAAACERCRL